MEGIDTKSHRLTAVPTVESFSPFAPIENMARKIFMRGKLTATGITTAVMSKLSAPGKENAHPLFARCYSEYSEQDSVLYILANNPKTSPALLDHISINSTTAISEAIAMNESAARGTLRRLANHVSPLVRAAVTENACAPFEILALLCKDEHPDVRFKMAENPHVPRSLLAELTLDDNPYVASRAITTLERLNSTANGPARK